MDFVNQLGNALNPMGRSGRVDWLLALGVVWLFGRFAIGATLASDSWPLIVPALLALWLFIATSIRRLHDLNLSGWYLLVYLVVPFAVILKERIESGLGPLSPVNNAFDTFELAARVVFVLWLALVAGSVGPNRFGSAPTPSWRLAR